MRFGSVCSGIEAASVAWGPLGWEAAWLSEIEPFCNALLAHYYPNTPNLGDMTTLPGRILAGEVEAPEVLAGGTPCQAFSVAGRRESLSDDRGNLTLKFIEVADAIDTVRSRRATPGCIVFWENVPGVLNTDDNAFGCFLAGLAGEDHPLQPPGGRWSYAGAVLGPRRAVAWRTLDAQYFGLAQRRRRVFVVASARDGFDPCAVLFESEGVRRDSPPSRTQGQATPSLLASGAGTSRPTQRSGEQWRVETALALTGSGRGVERVEESRGQDPVVAHAVTAKGGSGYMDATAETIVPVIPILEPGSRTGKSTTDPRAGMGIGKPGDPMFTLQGSREHAIAFSCKDSGADAGELSPTLRGLNEDRSHANGGGQVAVAFQQNSRSEVRQLGGDGSIAGALAVEPGMQQQNFIAVAFDLRGRDGGAQAEGAHDTANIRAVSGGSSRSYVASSMQVRRLLPIECERLQGFPDGYTAIPYRRGKTADDGPRYKAIGNSWAVPVVRWIGKRIAREAQAAGGNHRETRPA